MKASEAIRKYYDTIRAEMISCYRTVLECSGRIQYKIYIWCDGEIERLEAPQGDSAWLQPRDAEPRDLFHVVTVDAPFFDVWDYSETGKPEDPAEADELEREIIDYLVDSYDTESADEILSAAISDAEEAEAYQAEDDKYYI